MNVAARYLNFKKKNMFPSFSLFKAVFFLFYLLFIRNYDLKLVTEGNMLKKDANQYQQFIMFCLEMQISKNILREEISVFQFYTTIRPVQMNVYQMNIKLELKIAKI